MVAMMRTTIAPARSLRDLSRPRMKSPVSRAR